MIVNHPQFNCAAELIVNLAPLHSGTFFFKFFLPFSAIVPPWFLWIRLSYSQTHVPNRRTLTSHYILPSPSHLLHLVICILMIQTCMQYYACSLAVEQHVNSSTSLPLISLTPSNSFNRTDGNNKRVWLLMPFVDLVDDSLLVQIYTATNLYHGFRIVKLWIIVAVAKTLL